MVARWFESTAGDVGTRQREGRAMTRFEDWVREGTFAGAPKYPYHVHECASAIVVTL